MPQSRPSCLLIAGLCLIGLSGCSLTQQQPEPAPVAEKDKVNPAVIQLAKRDALIIGQRIWLNESSGKVEGLTAWNQGEEFPSFGVGHFLWYPPGLEARFIETFPDLVIYLNNQGVRLPEWLVNTPDCPWTTREAFLAEFQSPKMRQLRTLLATTLEHQVNFMIRRLERSLPKMLATLDSEQARQHVRTQFYRVAGERRGIYALVDYVNFKGEGVASGERYQGEGWGLLQVLREMPDHSNRPVKEFVNAAETVLKRRVKNSPVERNEKRWLLGWLNRLNTYNMPFNASGR